MDNRGEIKRYANPTDLPAKRSDGSMLPLTIVLVFGVISITALAVVALTAAVVAISVAVVAVALRPYLKR